MTIELNQPKERNSPRVLHAVFSWGMPVGIINQVRYETKAVQKLGLPWETQVVSCEPATEPFMQTIPMQYQKNFLTIRSYFWSWLKQHGNRFDFLLLRYIPFDPFGWLYSASYSNRATVHHTKEINEIRLGGWKGAIWAAGDAILGPHFIRSGRAVIGVTDEILNYEQARIKQPRPGFVTPNGIDLENVPLANDRRAGPAQILFVASHFSPWLGLDLLIDSFSFCKAPYCLHLVGEVPPSLLVRLRDFKPLRGEVVLHGILPQNEIFSLAALCDLGLSSFGLFRQNMREACTLKVREYLAQGLPVYSGHLDSGLPKHFPYYIQGPAEMSAIVRLAEQFRSVPRKRVREEAAPYIDKVPLIKQLYDFISAISS